MENIIERKKHERSRVAEVIVHPEASATTNAIALSLATQVVTELRNALEVAQAAGDYRITSTTEAIRRTLRAYEAGSLPLEQLRTTGPKSRVTVVLDAHTAAIHRSLPFRKRSEIVERALKSALCRGLEPLWTVA